MSRNQKDGDMTLIAALKVVTSPHYRTGGGSRVVDEILIRIGAVKAKFNLNL